MSYKDKLYELMDIIQMEPYDNEIAYGCLSDINELFAPILSELDEKDFYLWGLAHYSIVSEPTENSMIKFKKATQLNPEYYPARLYLGHCYHDKKEWYDAIEEYLKVDQEQLTKDFGIWRTAKLNEQIGFCYWQIDQKDEAMRFFENVVAMWNEHVVSEELLKPDDMITCIGANHKLLENIDISKMSW